MLFTVLQGQWTGVTKKQQSLFSEPNSQNPLVQVSWAPYSGIPHGIVVCVFFRQEIHTVHRQSLRVYHNFHLLFLFLQVTFSILKAQVQVILKGIWSPYNVQQKIQPFMILRGVSSLTGCELLEGSGYSCCISWYLSQHQAQYYDCSRN